MNKNKNSLQSRKPQAYSRKSGQTFSQNHYSTKICVGKKNVGKVVRDVFVKNVRSSIHFLKNPPAIAFDRKTILQAQKLGATRVKIFDLDTNLVYRASIELIVSKGFPVNRGYGDQIALALNYWDCQGQQGTGGPSPERPKFSHDTNTSCVINNSKFTNGGTQPLLFN